MKLSCPQILSSLAAFVDGEPDVISQEMSTAVRYHLRECGSCAQEFSYVTRITTQYRLDGKHLAAGNPPRELVTLMARAGESHERCERRSAHGKADHWLRAVPAVAAAVILLLVLAAPRPLDVRSGGGASNPAIVSAQGATFSAQELLDLEGYLPLVEITEFEACLRNRSASAHLSCDRFDFNRDCDTDVADLIVVQAALADVR